MDIKSSYRSVLDRIEKACKDCGRSPQEITLLVASKAQSLERILEVHALGQNDFAENYAQELIAKAPLAPSKIRWSFIGKLQSNKVKAIVRYADEIQTVTSMKQAELISRYAKELGKVPYKIFIEVQVPGDLSKSGLDFAQVPSFAKTISEQFSDSLHLQGIMAIPPLRFAKHWDGEAEAVYTSLRKLADGVGEKKLSLGMSQDLEYAIRFGSKILRIGTAIMGERKKT